MLALTLTCGLLGADPAKLPFEYPIYLAAGPDGSIYVADQDVPAVFRIGKDGKVSTFHKASKNFRTPLNRPRGIAVGKNGDVFVCDPSTMDVYRIGADGKAVGLTGKQIKELNGKPGVRGAFVQPEGVAVADSGTVFVSDLRLNAVFKLGAAGASPEKVADVAAPHGIVLDKDGSLVVVSHGESHLVRVDAKTGKTSKLLPGLLPLKQYTPFPLSVAILADGAYAVSDNYNRVVWRVTSDGTAEVLVPAEQLRKCTGLAVAGGVLHLVDPAAKAVYRFESGKPLVSIAMAN
jgi:streptogramin lyase